MTSSIKPDTTRQDNWTWHNLCSFALQESRLTASDLASLILAAAAYSRMGGTPKIWTGSTPQADFDAQLDDLVKVWRRR